MTLSFITSPLNAINTLGRTFSATVSDLEKLGWELSKLVEANFGDYDYTKEEYILINVSDDGRTTWIPEGLNTKYGSPHFIVTGDDAQTIADLEALRLIDRIDEEQ